MVKHEGTGESLSQFQPEHNNEDDEESVQDANRESNFDATEEMPDYAEETQTQEMETYTPEDMDSSSRDQSQTMVAFDGHKQTYTSS